MNLEQVSLKTIRVMLAVGAVAALAAVGTLAVLAEVPAASQDLQPYAGAQVPSSSRFPTGKNWISLCGTSIAQLPAPLWAMTL